jgi:dihydrofolate reductase
MTVGEIVVHEFTTLDGVIDAPSYARDYPFDPKMGQAIGAIMGSCTALLLGRRTFEMFAPAWAGRSAEDDPGAPFMNDSPKYVVGATPLGAEWINTTPIGPYDADALRALKDRTEGNLYVSGSGTLVHAMLADGLVDEVHLFVYPLALGAGQKLFADGGGEARFELAQAESYESGIVHLAYRPTR